MTWNNYLYSKCLPNLCKFYRSSYFITLNPFLFWYFMIGLFYWAAIFADASVSFNTICSRGYIKRHMIYQSLVQHFIYVSHYNCQTICYAEHCRWCWVLIEILIYICPLVVLYYHKRLVQLVYLLSSLSSWWVQHAIIPVVSYHVATIVYK